ncbi:c-type cytochrome domain-containing protein [Enhygromyxa salina]|uniref:Uncharacterized protein n=1 Tax=Enhygromyxa salina TaxID=215803 RepID=A0A2S9XWC3_9BACT|nr:c-type cytochrome domain-containing protein [Enhygromyxa salina]PRP97134.1 hypothetical protein ENSA7_67460 [Enhygromyxa salina]
MLRTLRWFAPLVALPLLACVDASAPDQADSDTGTSESDTGGSEPDDRVLVNHDFGEFVLEPLQELENCVQWTVDNDEAVYVQGVTLSNLGYFHHSNWFVVPETLYEGPDGFFPCGSRGFSELEAAISGTVLFAQSTQSFVEVQRTADGAVIKIPPRHKVVAGTHLLNVGPSEVSTRLFMSLEIIHPRDVELVLTPFRLSYLDIDIPAQTESRFTGVCDNFGERYAEATGAPINMKLHYAVAHYHYLGNYFDLSFGGGPLDGQSVYRLDGFNGEANGLVFDPPLDLAGVESLSYTCGYDNWRDVNVGWGIGDQEMCVMLGLAESKIMFDATVTGGTKAVGTSPDGALDFQGPCGVLPVAKNPAQAEPTDEERAGELYIPPSGDPGLPPVPACIDHDPSVAPAIEPTLSNVQGVVFQQSCSFNACHGDSGQAAGLNLQAPDLLAELLNHEVVGNPGVALVEPGDPENSWLYQIIASCQPDGGTGSHMPLNSPVLLDDRSIALVREWILDGAPGSP